MKTINGAQKNGSIGAQTDAAAENSFGQPQSKRPIGFVQKEGKVTQEEPKAEMLQLAASTSVFGLPASSANQLTDMLVTVADRYFQKRLNHCYVDGANQEFLESLNKIYIKYFDSII